MAFPPSLPHLHHIGINQVVEQLAFRGSHRDSHAERFDFDNLPPKADRYSADIRKEIGIRKMTS